ncbi:hypothetical protein CPC08DRAFT_770294 [Agrocybe pediades]|nr:hypothetical protein CPC08DRAFT_770294 [Agrocybe pediades]
MAYFRRNPKKKHPMPYHTALYLSPEYPPSDSKSLHTAVFHAINYIDPTLSPPQAVWKFDDEYLNRKPNLKGVVLLGKIDDSISKEQIKEMLKIIYVPEGPITEEMTWRCRDWIYDAVKTLVTNGILTDERLSSSMDEIWSNGYRFLDKKALEVDTRGRIPCCDLDGREIPCELRPTDIENK